MATAKCNNDYALTGIARVLVFDIPRWPTSSVQLKNSAAIIEIAVQCSREKLYSSSTIIPTVYIGPGLLPGATRDMHLRLEETEALEWRRMKQPVTKSRSLSWNVVMAIYLPATIASCYCLLLKAIVSFISRCSLYRVSSLACTHVPRPHAHTYTRDIEAWICMH